MDTYGKRLLRYTRQFERDIKESDYTAKDVARWMIEKGLWKAPTTLAIQRCAEELARTWREEYRTDPQGRRVRIRHAYVISRDGEQLHLWGSCENLKPKQMALAFQGRRRQIVGECRQLKNDVDSYNENYNAENRPIPMSYNFTMDMEETERRHSVSTFSNEKAPLSVQSGVARRPKASERVLSRS